MLIGGNFLYRYLLSTTALAPMTLVYLLGLPLLAGGVLAVFESEDRGRRGGLVVAMWFLAALGYSFAGLRFVMLLVPPSGILLGVALGRFHAWLVRVIGPRVAPARQRAIAAALFVACGTVLVGPVGRGADAARFYRPSVNDAWWDALSAIRDTAPRDAIVTAWWDYGHWIKYIAERRVTSDGGTLSSRVAHWIGRMLLAPTDREAIGLLRMLDCGSDVGPEGAMGRLAAHGVAEPTAYELVVELASLDRDVAQARLRAGGLTPDAADDVLAATHCTPPPAYLVLTTAMIHVPAWRHLGSFDPRRALAGMALGPGGVDAAVTALRDTFALSEPAARPLAERAARLRTAAELEEFVSPRLGYLTADWLGCQVIGPGDWTCPVRVPVDAAGTFLDAVQVRPDAPASSRLRLRGRDAIRDGEPATLVLAGAERMDTFTFAAPADERLAVLVDVPNRRVLVGPPHLVRSTFTQLVYLDGRTAPGFEKIDERVAAGERVVTWRVRDTAAR